MITHIEEFAEFDDYETRLILVNTPLEELPKTTYEKLEAFNFVGDYDILARNLNALIGRNQLNILNTLG